MDAEDIGKDNERNKRRFRERRNHAPPLTAQLRALFERTRDAHAGRDYGRAEGPL